MKILRFKGKDVSEALQGVRDALGQDAIILETKTRRSKGRSWVEVVAALDDDTEVVVQEEKKPSRPRPKGKNMAGLSRRLPSAMGFIGLNGAGKTTALLKMAITLSRKGKRSAIINVDNKKLGAKEALMRAAELMESPFYHVRTPVDLLKVMAELSGDYIALVDFPGENLFEERRCEVLRKYFLAAPHLKAVGVLEANMHPVDMRALLGRFEEFPLWGTCVAKVDQLVDNTRTREILAHLHSSVVYLSKSEGITDPLEEFYMAPSVPVFSFGDNLEQSKELTCG